MPFNLLLLPLLGGYIFILMVPPLRFRHQEHHGYRLLLGSAIIGVCSMAASSVLMALLVRHSLGRQLQETVQQLWPFDFIGTATGALVLPLLLAPLTWLWSGPEAVKRRRFLRNVAGELVPRGDAQSVIFHAAVNGIPILVTLENRKVYVGFVLGSPDLSGADYISILPIWSGYRMANNLRLRFTTRYDEVLLRELESAEEGGHIGAAMFTVVIAAKRIISLQPFDPDFYKSAFADKGFPTASDTPTA